jgi:hypothetical protein
MVDFKAHAEAAPGRPAGAAVSSKKKRIQEILSEARFAAELLRIAGRQAQGLEQTSVILALEKLVRVTSDRIEEVLSDG